MLYAELDEWNSRIAELQAEREGTERARSAATQARNQAEESHTAADGEDSKAPEFTPSPELKNLFREVAKRVHPHLAKPNKTGPSRNSQNLPISGREAWHLGQSALVGWVLSKKRHNQLFY